MEVCDACDSDYDDDYGDDNIMTTTTTTTTTLTAAATMTRLLRTYDLRRMQGCQCPLTRSIWLLLSRLGQSPVDYSCIMEIAAVKLIMDMSNAMEIVAGMLIADVLDLKTSRAIAYVDSSDANESTVALDILESRFVRVHPRKAKANAVKAIKRVARCRPLRPSSCGS